MVEWKDEWKDTIDFWKFVGKAEAYKDLGEFLIQITALPQSTACIGRKSSEINNNKTKPRKKLAISTTEAIVKVSVSIFQPILKSATSWQLSMQMQEARMKEDIPRKNEKM